MSPACSYVCYLGPTFNGGFNGALAVSENSLDQEQETAEDGDLCGEGTVVRSPARGVEAARSSRVQLGRLGVVL